jgi:hypothetical protein
MPDVEATFGKTRRCFQQRQPMGEKGEAESGRILRRTKFSSRVEVFGSLSKEKQEV